jgi:hypothetical protein
MWGSVFVRFLLVFACSNDKILTINSLNAHINSSTIMA